jgi:hypothetical protein
MLDSGTKRNPSQSQILIELVLEAGVELFHTPDGRAYATVPVFGHRETWPVTAKGSGPFRNWLRRLFYDQQGKPPGAQALQDALGLLEAFAQFDCPEFAVFTRVAEKDGRIYLDLGNAAWEAVEIGPDGWRVLAEPPVKFRRAKGMLPLPRPERGGSLDELRRFVNVPDEASWRLLVAWLLAAIRPSGPYPVLLLQGEQGSAKSTTARVLRALVDPNAAPLRALPREERDLMIAASNAWVVGFDNLSGIPAWLSDAICRLCTGAGFATRTLYEDEEETIFSVSRPVVANGIDELASRHDLLDRAIVLNLAPIPEEDRVDEATFWKEFEEARPRILGALLDAVSAGLRNLSHVELDRLPRMADFAKWVTACEEALPWPAGGFLEAYAGNRAEAVEAALETDPLAAAVKSLLEEQPAWEGTASELLSALEPHAPEQARRGRSWPASARSLGNRLRRSATFLRQAGVDLTFFREAKSGRRLIKLAAKNGDQTAQDPEPAPGPAHSPVAPPPAAGVTFPGDKGDDVEARLVKTSPQEALRIKEGDIMSEGDNRMQPLSARLTIATIQTTDPNGSQAGPPERCPACRGREWWRSRVGRWVCNRCHPCPDPKMALEWKTIPEGGGGYGEGYDDPGAASDRA